MNTPRTSQHEHLSVLSNDRDAVYQLLKRTEMNPAEVDDASSLAVEVTVLWERAVLHVAHLDSASEFTLTTRAPTPTSPVRVTAPGLALGATMMLTGASVGAHGNLGLAGLGALASAAALGAGVLTQHRNEQHNADTTRFVVDASVLGGAEAPVVVREGESARFVLLPGAQGEVEIAGVRRELGELIASGIAHPSSRVVGAHEVNLVPDGRYRMEIAGLVIQARVVSAARRVPVALRKDGTLRAAWAGSALAAAVALGVLRLAAQDSAYMTAETDDARLAELRDFVARQSEQIAKTEEAREAAAADAPAGAAHAETAGSMGDRRSTASHRRYEIRATTERPHLARERSAREQVQDRGIFAAFGGTTAANMGSHSGIVSPFGEMTEAGTGSRDANGNMNGVDVGDSFGGGGLDTVGTGIGGGGHDTGIGTGPLGTQGHGNCRPGDDCRYGVTSGTHLGPRENHGPVVRPQRDVTVEGTIPQEAIRRVVIRNLGQVNRCYEQGLAQNPSAQGRVAVRFVIAGGGAVLAAGVAEDGLHMPSVSACIAGAVRRWTFPVPEASGPITVTYPFSLMPADQ